MSETAKARRLRKLIWPGSDVMVCIHVEGCLLGRFPAYVENVEPDATAVTVVTASGNRFRITDDSDYWLDNGRGRVIFGRRKVTAVGE